MNLKNGEESEQQRCPGQEGAASRAKSQMLFPGSTGQYPRRDGHVGFRYGSTPRAENLLWGFMPHLRMSQKIFAWRASPAPAALFGGKMDRRGMMDDLFDFLFTVLISFFIFFFINGLLDRGIETGHSQTRSGIAEFHERASAITHLAIQAQRGEVGELEAGKLDDKLKQNKVIGGKTIAKCEDYETKVDCENDPLKVRQFKAGISEKCRWKKNKCLLQSR